MAQNTSCSGRISSCSQAVEPMCFQKGGGTCPGCLKPVKWMRTNMSERSRPATCAQMPRAGGYPTISSLVPHFWFLCDPKDGTNSYLWSSIPSRLRCLSEVQMALCTCPVSDKLYNRSEQSHHSKCHHRPTEENVQVISQSSELQHDFDFLYPALQSQRRDIRC